MTTEKPLSEKIMEGVSSAGFSLGKRNGKVESNMHREDLKVDTHADKLYTREEVNALIELHNNDLREIIERVKVRSTGVTHCDGFIKILEEEFGDLEKQEGGK